MSKDVILSNVKSALEQNKLKSASKSYVDLIKHKENSIVKEYIEMQNANKAMVIESNDVSKDIKKILDKLDSKKVLYSLDVEDYVSSIKEYKLTAYNKSVDVMRDELFSIDTSIIKAKCGIADVGIFGIASSPKEPRLASLITENCIVILEKKNIVQSIIDGVNTLKGKENLPSNMIFIAGPSRTADIELKTVFGVHGPQQVYIILI
ncbi:lactate utilization protein C [Helicobacter sp. MIT 14-3879]|uniref:LutC/YkgG family protein n=1 Tax=Helicobacter sp. MIT 14-3879 TaxID=2040649 RepID=UPI000E1F9C4A|nr:lactate utilization protein C [Helicobacter sp. MIT 14-3879]RDU62421.1 lactate utilization protein C [Helicobacter sp. MIT 14-3879]